MEGKDFTVIFDMFKSQQNEIVKMSEVIELQQKALKELGLVVQTIHERVQSLEAMKESHGHVLQ